MMVQTIRTGKHCARQQRGFTYMLVLFLVAFLGAGLAVASDVWSTAKQRQRELDLLFNGDALRLAIASYYKNSPGAFKQYPPQLEDLIKDPRFPDTRRHLRQLYPDPFSGTTDWVLIKAPQGGIMGVASASEAAPLKRTNFRGPDHVFEDQAKNLKEKLRYRDWEFIYNPALRENGL
jgi:type II secretory pathway pseudopilin PulG